MSKKRSIALGAIVLLVALTGAGSALALSSGDRAGTVSAPAPSANQEDTTAADNESAEDSAEGPDVPITGPDLERASAVALDHLGGGRVTATEIEDEESYYEVEVQLDGREVDVQLDESFNVVGLD